VVRVDRGEGGGGREGKQETVYRNKSIKTSTIIIWLAFQQTFA